MYIDSFIYFSILAVAIGYGLLVFQHLEKPYRLLVMLLVCIVIDEVIAHYLLYSPRKNNLIVYHFFAPIHFLFLTGIYFLFTRPKTILRYITLFSFPVIPILSVINILYWQDIHKNFPSNILLLSSVFFLIYILGTFLDMMKHMQTTPLTRQSLFWFNTANLIYFSVAFFYLGLQNVLRGEMPSIFEKVMPIITILTYLMCGISLYLASKKPRYA